MAKIPLHPKNPERVCWGCDKYCPADHLDCGNGTIRTQHPIELFGDDWLEWAEQRESPENPLHCFPETDTAHENPTVSDVPR